MNKEPIFTLTVLCEQVDLEMGNRPRTWSWFPTKEQAVESLHKDTDFYFEHGYYDHCVIEEVRPHSMGPHKQTWFEVRFSPNDESYTIIGLDGPPKELEHIVNWSLG